MKKMILTGAAVVLTMTAFGASAATNINKTYLRKGTQEVRVFTKDGKLYCRRVKDNFEMCHGMDQQPDGTWTGKKMKHPDMPGFMTFNGTVVIGSNKKLSIKGCMIGGAFCASEIWDEK